MVIVVIFSSLSGKRIYKPLKHRPRAGSSPLHRRGVGERSELIFKLFNFFPDNNVIFSSLRPPRPLREAIPK
jgi:hypothetical protein